ncbi:hypothetical protein B9T26_13330 [Acinetobacter sp. ANC 4169]|uniref:DUF6176 family protein n=1 Tax=Acinetobacter sp. ANC 4169 TaxID=1977879 RepID=UPI000A34F9C8|nr:DUF6176 family protein [Acinetobacter sp. ANC 4169]OTG70720.1 hypothetical protein B9T26_13330 [Acinetobacter sp. ANC 4169]
MDVGAVLIKLKPDALHHVEQWKNELNARKAEAIETLRAEGVHVESWFHLELDGQDYLLAYMRAEDIARAQQIGRESQFSIDQVHKQFKSNWAKVIPAKLLLDLENIHE